MDATVLAALITFLPSAIIAAVAFVNENRARRTDRARVRLAAGGDALEKFHWALKDALQYFPIDTRHLGPKGKSDVKRAADLTEALEVARAEASRQGTQLAIEFGKDSVVISIYDSRQKDYRRLMMEILGDNCAGIQPASRNAAQELWRALIGYEGCTDYIDAAAAAVKVPVFARKAPRLDPETQEQRAAERARQQTQGHEDLHKAFRPETARKQLLRPRPPAG